MNMRLKEQMGTEYSRKDQLQFCVRQPLINFNQYGLFKGAWPILAYLVSDFPAFLPDMKSD